MAKQSLAATTEKMELVPMEVPEFGGLAVTQSRAFGPYVVFAQPKATDQWTSLVQKLPGIQDGDQVLVMPEPEPPIALRPMRFTMVACTQYWCRKDQQGAMVGKPSLTVQPRSDGWQENIFAACLVYVPRGGDLEAVPATCGFKSVKCPAAVSLKMQIEAAAKPDWADQSTAHRAAFAAFSKPWLRVVAAVATNKRTAGSGFAYVGARSVVSPITPAEWLAVKKLLEEGDGVKKLRDLQEHYSSRLKEIGIS